MQCMSNKAYRAASWGNQHQSSCQKAPRALLRSCAVTPPRSVFQGRSQLQRRFAGTALRTSVTNGIRLYAVQWLENSAETEVQVPLEEAWELWDDRELIPRWMPWIRSVTVQPDDPKLSRWLLSTNQFGRDWEFSWLAQNLTPMKHQKIHWRSVPGSTGQAIEISNRGQIRFYRKSPQSCSVKLTISYELPDVLVPFGNSLTPLVEGILQRDMTRFAKYATQGTTEL